MQRRTFLRGITTAGLAAAVPPLVAIGQTPPSVSVSSDFDGMEVFDTFETGFSAPDYKLSPDYGTVKPPEFYSQIAAIILRGAPVKSRPVDVARYLYDVRRKVLTEAVRGRLEKLFADQTPKQSFNLDFVSLFAYDWERNSYYNPLIVRIITGTKTSAYNGDITPWCASFTNWCIARSQASNPNFVTFDDLLKHGTRSAASGSFRCWGTKTDAPKYGDVVVYAKVGTENQSCPVDLNNAQGHVGFYFGQKVRHDGSIAYDVLGGNQGFVRASLDLGPSAIAEKDIAQAVSVRGMGQKWADRVFHSVRTAPVLHG